MKKIILLFILIAFQANLTFGQQNKLKIYHFHVKERCPMDERIEQMTITVLDSLYSKELKSGKIIRKSVNFDLKRNARLAARYKITTISMIFSINAKGVETVIDLTDWAFKYAFNDPVFKKELIEKINDALVKISQ